MMGCRRSLLSSTSASA